MAGAASERGHQILLAAKALLEGKEEIERGMVVALATTMGCAKNTARKYLRQALEGRAGPTQDNSGWGGARPGAGSKPLTAKVTDGMSIAIRTKTADGVTPMERATVSVARDGTARRVTIRTESGESITIIVG